MNDVVRNKDAVSRRVLVVEDDAALRDLIAKSLTRAGFEVGGVPSGTEAIIRIEANPAQVLLLDQRLPDMSGQKVVEALIERGITTPFIIMTGHGDERLAVEMMKRGAADYLLKDTELINLLPGVLERVFRGIETEQRLRDAEESLHLQSLVLDQIEDHVTITDLNGVITYVNQAVIKALGRSKEELIGATTDIYGESTDQGAAQREILEETLKDGAWRGEVVNYDANGNEIIMDCRTQVIHDEQGKPIALCGVATNVTERKRAERELKRALAHNTALLNAIPDLVFLFDADCRFIDCHVQRPEQEFYAPPKTFLGKRSRDVLPEAVACLTEEKVKEVLRTGAPSYSSYELEIGGGIQYFECRYVVCGESQVMAIVRNITDQKRAEDEREQLQAQLTQAQKMESVGRLAGGVAHDFNNMLGVILGHAELALERADPSDATAADLMEIRKATERSADLTRQLLAFARKQTVTPRVLDLNETVNEMLKMLRRLIGETIELDWRPGVNVGRVRMDPSQIDQILVNLCVNARDAIRDAGKITIETSTAVFQEAYCLKHAAYSPGDYVMLSVSDNGPGMDSETLTLVFEPFFTTKGVGEGTGLGLSTVYGIVRQNNGFIHTYSEPGRGTTFKIYLPRYTAPTERAPRVEEPEKAATPGQETILLVEDEPAILNMTRNMLKRMGYTVLIASTPGEALRLAREYAGQIDLLMTDVIMPEMDGRDLAKNLLALYPEIKRLFMSGYTASVIAHRGVLDEGVHFIQKPFSTRDLSNSIRKALE